MTLQNHSLLEACQDNEGERIRNDECIAKLHYRQQSKNWSTAKLVKGHKIMKIGQQCGRLNTYFQYGGIISCPI